MTFSAAILTGGAGSRMNGQLKYLLKINGKSILQIQIEVLSKCFDDIVVVGKNATKHTSDIKIIADIYEGAGPLGGIHAALSYFKTSYVFILSGDMPFVSERLIGLMKERIIREKDAVLIPRHAKGIEPLHAFYDSSLALATAAVLNSGQRSIRALFPRTQVSYFDLPDNAFPDEIFFNINYPKDYIKALKYAKRIEQRGCLHSA